MERTENDCVYVYNTNKRQKLQNELIKNKSCFENLANETIYEIFQYLDVYHIYEGFFYLNQRFQNIIVNTNLLIQINVSTMSKSNFELYHKNMIEPNKHRINYLRLSNPFTIDIIFFPARIICDYIQLERLILDNIDAKYLNSILKHLAFLPKLDSLVLTPIDYVQDTSIFFISIFSLPKLKSCILTYRTKYDEQPMPIYMTDFKDSPIEYFLINNRFSIESLNDIFFCLPKLRYLSIDCLVGCDDPDIDEDPIVSKYLNNVSIKVDSIDFNLLQKLIKRFFYNTEILHISTKSDQTYLDAKQWEELILSSMPNLHTFDISHDGGTYHDLINQFNSSFWIKKQWFFTHQHDSQETLDSGIFYSTNPYRRKTYTFYWQFDQHVCSNMQEKNLNIVKHVHICSKQIINNYVNYFPNANQLTIEHYFKTSDDSISTTLNCILPLKQLTKLNIKSSNFPFEQIIKLIYFTPNLHVLKLDFLCLNEIYLKLIEQHEIFRYVSSTNKITNIDIREKCTLEIFQLIIYLFPQVEYLKIRINEKEISQIIRFLFSKTTDKIRRLFFLCISQIPKVCLRELNFLIKSENLLSDYSIKYINRDLYLWW
ncbi:unnamed protein product [Rotaria sordida]|uniref:F-box domain-containing protein n=1 Tax=Rotaria sordida TaxID=392033 RepID=A0A815IAN1_9BILA|nr:unnamed protein product [Rotaria sordida]CAF4009950.1 unnamed protein product [Rotaria sordida]